MKKIYLISFLFCIASSVHAAYEVCFTPQQKCTTKIVKFILNAKKSIYMQAYSFTSRPIAHALLGMYKKGVKVYIILDQANFTCQEFSFGSLMIRHHIPVWNDNQLAIAHNKVLIVDQKFVETGSFNYTKAAQYHNAENVLIIKDKKLATAYLQNWNRRRDQSKLITQDPCPQLRYW